MTSLSQLIIRQQLLSPQCHCRLHVTLLLWQSLTARWMSLLQTNKMLQAGINTSVLRVLAYKPRESNIPFIHPENARVYCRPIRHLDNDTKLRKIATTTKQTSTLDE